MNTDDIAVLLIDMQEEFTGYIGDRLNGLIEAQLGVIKYCSDKDIPLVILEYDPSSYATTEPVLKKSISRVPRHTFIGKDSRSGFVRTNLDEVLYDFNRFHLYLMGIYANQCVRATAQSAIEKGYGIATSGDVISEVNGKLFTTWFEENGLFTRTYKGMIKTLEKSL